MSWIDIILAGIGVMLQIYVTWRDKGSTLSRDIVMLLAGYVIISTASFFLPLWTAHTAMSEAKHAQLDEISERFQTSYVELTTQLDNSNEPLDEPIERFIGRSKNAVRNDRRLSCMATRCGNFEPVCGNSDSAALAAGHRERY